MKSPRTSNKSGETWIAPDLNSQLMVLAAVRYCLGRASYIVGCCIEWLTLHWDEVTPKMQETILRDIRESLVLAVMDMDRQSWERFLDGATKAAKCEKKGRCG